MQNNRSRLRRLALTHVAALAFLLLGHAVARAVPVVGLTTENELVMFDSNAPGHVFHRVAVNNLAETGEVLIGIDYRPSNGRVYGLSDRSRVYIVDVATGRVVALGGRFSPPLQDIGPQTGREVGFDIDPVQDRARVVGCSVNYQLALDTGGVIAAHNALTFAPGQPRAGQRACASGAAYSNNFRGATSTTLYAIDSSADELMTVGSVGGSPSSPNSGQVFVVGKLFGPHPATEFAAFDIAPGTASLAFVALTGADAVATRLGTVNLSTGRADIIDHIGGQQGSAFVYLRGMAVLPADADLYGVTVTNKLLRFNAAAPGVIVSSKQITGLPPNEQIVGIDFGHAVGPASLGVSEPQLYALGSSGAVYVINPATGTPSRFLSVRMPPLEGTSFGFEFMGGFFRITSDTGQNMTVSEFTPPNVHAPPAYAGDDANAGKTPKVVGLGFRQSPPPGGATAGTLYGIDSAQNTLVTFNPEPATLRTVGSLSLFLTGNVVGFDIPTGSDTGFAAVSPLCFEGCPTPSTLVRVSLQFGQASVAGGIGGGEQVRALAAAPAFTFSFTQATRFVSEGHTSILLTVVRTGDATSAATVDYATSEGSDDPNEASPRSDFNAAYGTLRFAPGESTKTIEILLNEDSYVEGATLPAPETGRGEHFTVSLADPSPGYFLSPAPAITVFIEDDNPEQTTNPIDESGIFVRQHYHDFLNREGDLPGIVFWTQNIESCATAPCRANKRIETSAAFFLSIEFQETGFLAYRFHEAAFDTGEKLSLFDFLRDAQRIGEGVVVGQGDWQARLEANKRAYAEEFVARPSFSSQYAFLTNEQYVDKLDFNAGGVLTLNERTALVNGLNSGTLTRAQVLRAIADDADLRNLQRNRAFVYMQYVGYLRREPDDAGFAFWLNKLEEHEGDFRRAEMVKAFITSGEYRSRFGAQ